mgnify:FL=1
MANLEGLRLSHPAEFWRLLRPPHPPVQVPPAVLHAHYAALLGAAPPGGVPEALTGVVTAPCPAVTGDEVRAAVRTLRAGKALRGIGCPLRC